VRHQRRTRDYLMAPVLKETQECLPKFITVHLLD
jgi:hypothetical protein